MAAQESAALAAVKGEAASGAEIPGDVHTALEDMNLPAYAVDRYGIIRWLNPAARELVGDIRGRQQSSVVVPEQAREAKESFLRKMMGTEKSTDATVVVVEPDGTRVQVEISSCTLREGGRIVGVFGVVRHRDDAPAPDAHPHLTPRQNQILHLLAHGRSTQQIAAELHLSPDTVRNHIRRMLRALDAHSRIEALAVAHRAGILR
jgi:PAS domain S-box-containing protein